jgi:CheY-like chemotaxis protein
MQPMTRQIMIVDDDASGLALFEMMLKRSGYEILKVTDARMAVHMLESNSPDLFIVDLMMPEVDGFQLLEYLRQRSQTAQTPVVVLTAREDYESQDRCIKLGANSYLTKPVTRTELVEAVDALLGN